MDTEQTGSSTRPVAVDESFFRGLSLILSEFDAASIQGIAESLNLSIQQVEEIDRLESEPSGSDMSTYKAYSKLRDGRSKAINATYDNGYSFRTQSLEELKTILQREPGRIDSLSFTVGSSQYLFFSIRLSSLRSYYSVQGSRKNVNHFSKRFVEILRASEPVNCWLHTKWPGRAIMLISFLSFTAAYLVILTRYSERLGEEATTQLAGLVVVLGAVGMIVGHFAAEWFRAAFPRLAVEFGPDNRRRSGLRATLWALGSVLVIPLILALLVG